MTPDEIQQFAVHLGQIDVTLANMDRTFTGLRSDIVDVYDRLRSCETDLAIQREKCRQVQHAKQGNDNCPPGSVSLKTLTAIISAVTTGLLLTIGGIALGIAKAIGWL